jgi:hypothetical protein
MFAFSLSPLNLEELEALEAKEKEAKPDAGKAKTKPKATAARKPRSGKPAAAAKR